MNWNARRILSAILFGASVLTIGVRVRAQNSVGAAARPAITVLDSTKEQDGLAGSVRRVKTETAKIEFKDGRPIEGPTQLVEITTYGIKGNRIENTSYPISGSLVGKEEYKYDERGNITEMTLRDEGGAILSRELYSYEFDKFGNWTKMVTSLVVFEKGELKREPIEVTYRTVTYYFDDSVAKIVDETKAPTALAVPEPAPLEVRDLDSVKVDLGMSPDSAVFPSSLDLAGDPPPLLLKRLKLEKVNLDSETGNDRTDARGLSDAPVAAPEGTQPASSEVKAPVASEIKPALNVTEINPAVVGPGAASTTEGNSAEISNQTLANEFYVTGRNRFEAGDVRGAVESYLQSIKLEPKSAEVYLNLGHAYLKLEKDRDAIKAFKESIKLNATNAETQYGLGFACFRLGRFRDAADAFKKAIALNPQMAKAHFGLSLAYQELGMTSELLGEYRILERLDGSLARKLAQTFPQYDFSCRLTRGCP